MYLGVKLVRRGVITADDFVAAVERQMDQRPRLGRLALDRGKLTMKQVFAVLEEQTVGSKPFGETAVELGFVTKRQVAYLLRLQRDLTPSFSECLVAIGAADRESLERVSSDLRVNQALHRGGDSAHGRGTVTADSTEQAELAAS